MHLSSIKCHAYPQSNPLLTLWCLKVGSPSRNFGPLNASRPKTALSCLPTEVKSGSKSREQIAPLVRTLFMNRWPRFLQRIFALVTSPGFADMDPAEQDRLYEQVARATRAESMLSEALPPHLFYAYTVRRALNSKNRPSGGAS